MRRAVGALLLFVALGATLVASESACRSSWLADDLPQLLQDDGWDLTEQRHNVDVAWRPSTSAHHVARKYRAIVSDLPASVEEVLAAWHTNAYSPQAMARRPELLDAHVVETYSSTEDVVYEQHGVPDYISLYPAAHRDWLFARCVKEEAGGYVITYRSVDDARHPNATGYMRGWVIDSAVLIRPSPLGNGMTELRWLNQRAYMCCTPVAVHDVHQPQVMAEALARLREQVGGHGPCEGDQTSSRDDLHAACHLLLSFPSSSCGEVWSSIRSAAAVEDKNGLGYDIREVWSNDNCLEAVHSTTNYLDDVHFEVAASGPSSCAVRASSRSRSFSHYDMGTNYCNIYNLLHDGPAYEVVVDSCLYRPHTDAGRFCSKADRQIADVACTLDFFDLFC